MRQFYEKDKCNIIRVQSLNVQLIDDSESENDSTGEFAVRIGLIPTDPNYLINFCESFFYSRTLYQHHILFEKFRNRSHFILKYRCHTDLSSLIVSGLKAAINFGGVYHEHDSKGNCITKYYATFSSAIGSFNLPGQESNKLYQFTLCSIWRNWEFITAYPVGNGFVQSEVCDIPKGCTGIPYPRGEGYDHSEDPSESEVKENQEESSNSSKI